ncbi:HTTM domain-containing protein [Streptomyces sp. NPDC020799]|uniref:HTTM domain-containing protein n=1 Tax=Streptomyces sp. NPDC020799 TaxID=3365091 RepID=UPI0037A805E4
MSAPLAPLARGIDRVTRSALGRYQTAVIRIGISFAWLCFLLREWPNRHEMYGPDGPWSWDMARRLTADNHAFTALVWSDSTLWFETVYALAIVSSALLMLGWRTRTMSVLFMIGVLSLQNRSVFLGDGGDNVIHLLALYTVLTRCGLVWSLDARSARRRRTEAADDGRTGGPGPGAPAGLDVTGILLWAGCGLALAVTEALGNSRMSWTADGPLPGLGWSAVFWGLWLVQGLWWCVRRYAPGEPRTVLDAFANLAHNATLLVIMAEVCLIYSTAGWYKIQGSRWQDGTALYYPLHLDYFSPWPELSDILGGNSVIVLLLSYGTVAVQVAFPFTLLNRRAKNVLLAVMMCEHLGIAVTLGLPFFSLAMIVADAVFLPTSFLRRVGALTGRARDRLLPARAASIPSQREDEESPRSLVG